MPLQGLVLRHLIYFQYLSDLIQSCGLKCRVYVITLKSVTPVPTCTSDSHIQLTITLISSL